MLTHHVSALRQRPIRELIWPDVEKPTQRLEDHDERRHYHRYGRRQLPGALLVDGAEHRVRCVDIGYGGMQVLAPRSLRIADGKQVAIRIDQGLWSFQDEFSVRRSEPKTNGTAIHLAL